MASVVSRPESEETLGARLWRAARWVVVLVVVLVVAVVYLSIVQFGAGPAAVSQLAYLPVVVAAVRFGVRGGVVTSLLAAAVAASAAGVAQDFDVEVHVALLGGYLLVGAVVGSAVRALLVRQQRELADWWDSELGITGDAPDRPTMLTDEQVHRMVRTRDFYPVFQPIYALDDGRLVAVEALTRFDSEPPLPPSEWFGRAGQLGLGTALEIAAIEKAMQSSSKLAPHIVLSVNASASTLVAPELVDVVRRLPRTLMLELTELEPITNYPQLYEALTSLRAAGARIAIDNVGASLTSLRHIGRLAPDVIKLDGQLTNDARGDPMRWTLTRRILQYARSSGAVVIAEGIEEAEDLELWRQLGVTAAQGYLLGRPGKLTFVDPFDFPEARGRRRARPDSRVLHPRDRAGLDEALAPSQLTDEPFWGEEPDVGSPTRAR